MDTLEQLRGSLPDAARDIRINLQTVLQPGALSAAQVFGVALSAARAARSPELVKALQESAQTAGVPEGVFEDAKAAAILMAMNNVYYRFRHIVGKEEYSQKPARLRMQRLNQVATNKGDFELFCLAVSAVNNCQTCVQSHEASVLSHGLHTDQVHDAVRIAATVYAAALALEAR
jgi:alkyl hydroperoxide reductase subunit D